MRATLGLHPSICILRSRADLASLHLLGLFEACQVRKLHGFVLSIFLIRYHDAIEVAVGSVPLHGDRNIITIFERLARAHLPRDLVPLVLRLIALFNRLGVGTVGTLLGLPSCMIVLSPKYMHLAVIVSGSNIMGHCWNNARKWENRSVLSTIMTHHKTAIMNSVLRSLIALEAFRISIEALLMRIVAMRCRAPATGKSFHIKIF